MNIFGLTLTLYIWIIYDDFLYDNKIDKFIYNSLTLFQVLEDEIRAKIKLTLAQIIYSWLELEFEKITPSWASQPTSSRAWASNTGFLQV